MPEDDRKDATRDAVAREIEAAVNEQVSGCPGAGRRAAREDPPARAGRDRAGSSARTASERREAARLAKEARKKEKLEEEGETFLRFNRNFRFQHMVMFSSVILLIITGMPLKFPNFLLSRFVINFWEGSRTPPSSTASARGC